LKLLTTLLLLLLVVAALAAWAIYAPIGPAAGTSDEAATYVDIAPGTGTESIAAQLQEAGVLRSRFVFDLLRAVKGGKLIAGEYRFNQPATASEVYARMVGGDVYSIPVTIPEGYNIFEIAQAVESAGLGQREAFLAAERSQTSLIADLSPQASSLEGYLFPDTYRFSRHATPEQMVRAMVRRFRQVAVQLGAAGRAVSRGDLRLRPAISLAVQHLSPGRAATGTDLEPRGGRAEGRFSTGADRFSLLCRRRRGPEPLLGNSERARPAGAKLSPRTASARWGPASARSRSRRSPVRPPPRAASGHPLSACWEAFQTG
jgi:hypothetical protein